jgi:hypothetical protein
MREKKKKKGYAMSTIGSSQNSPVNNEKDKLLEHNVS